MGDFKRFMHFKNEMALDGKQIGFSRWDGSKWVRVEYNIKGLLYSWWLKRRCELAQAKCSHIWRQTSRMGFCNRFSIFAAPGSKAYEDVRYQVDEECSKCRKTRSYWEN